MPKAKRLKRNSGELMEVDDPVPSSSGTSMARKVPVENTSDSEDELELYEELHFSEDEDGAIRIGDMNIPAAPKPALTFDPTGPRMIITHIVNENFKSYAGTEFLGPFHKSFTAIIGPNGSGKSNVIDSMLFVFGYRASKIRSKKLSVLIHSSSRYPNVQSATVTVHFSQIIDTDVDSYRILPDTSINVSRTAFRDNSSYYKLNGKKVQFKDVSQVLRNYGIDLDHNRFLILQGEVEQIAMMKPKGQSEHDIGMLEYLEDIIGTSRYKVALEKLVENVDFLTEVRKNKLNRVRFVESEKMKLEQPMKDAVELMNLTNKTVRMKNMLLQKYSYEIGKLEAVKEKTVEAVKAKLAELDELLAQQTRELEEKNTILKQGTQKYDVLYKEKDSIMEKLQVQKRKTVSVQGDITQSNKKKKNLDQLLEQERGKLIELEMIPEKNTREIADCEKLLSKLNENKRKADEELQTMLAGVRAQTQGLQENKDRLQAKLIGLKKIVDETNKSFKLAESELKIYLSTERKETEKLENMKENYEKAKKDMVEKKRIQQQLSKTLPDSERELSELQSQLQNIMREEFTVQNESRTLRSQLEESRQAMTANRSRNRVLDSLMKEKQNGNLPGIFGRLGDLGGIDLKYDVAISTCCPSLDNIVVDTVETAQACVEYLKKNDIGRATFVALDKQMHLKRAYERREKYPENAPRLFDLIKVKDERVLPAFYFALRNTLVANDLDQASRIAYGATRYRVVTLKGDVIEVAGTMSGGGRTTERGRMAGSVRQDTSSEQDPALLQAKERKLASLEQRLSELREQQRNNEDTVGTLQRTVRENQAVLDKVNMELRSLTEQVPIIQNQIRQQEEKVASSQVDEGWKTHLQSIVNEAKEKLEKAKSDAKMVETEVQGVDAQITAIAGGRVKDMQKCVDDLDQKMAKITTEMTKLKVAINGSIRNAKKSKDKIAQMEADLAETVRNLENLGAQKKELTLDSAQLQKKIEEIDEQLNEGTGEFSGLKKEITKLYAAQNKLKNNRLDIVNELNDGEKLLQDYRVKTRTWDNERSVLKLEQLDVESRNRVVPGLEPVEPLVTHTEEELDAIKVEDLRNTYKTQKKLLGDQKPNIRAITDFIAKEKLYLKRAAVLENITRQRNDKRGFYDRLRKMRQNDFLAGFNTITAKLKEMYQMITLGGDAELELVDSLDPFTEGIIFSVRPPNKSWKNISNLSGGEKTLSSLALVFALHYYRPTPLYVMDEIDAALDFKNVSIVANYIKDRTRNAQFVIISLRYIMFETSNRLVGIYKVKDCTKSVTVQNEPILPDMSSKSRDKDFYRSI